VSDGWDIIAGSGCFLFGILLPFHYESGGLGYGYIVSNASGQQYQNGLIGFASVISGGLPVNYSSPELPPELTVDDLSQGAAQIDRNGLTYAGRALEKHGNRIGDPFPLLKGKASTLKNAGQNIVDDILTTPGTTFEQGIWIRNGIPTVVINVIAPNGLGLRFDAFTGILFGFLK
jgi:hypothetical protein